MKKNPYFSHDINAQYDEKLLTLRTEFGLEGYGFYWIVLETMANQEDYSLTDSEYLIKNLSIRTGISKKKVEEIFSFCKKIKLFSEENGKIFSKSLKKRMELMENISKKNRENIMKRWGKSFDRITEENTGVIQIKENKIKENKEEEKREEENNPPSPKNKKIDFDYSGKKKFLEFVWLTEDQEKKLKDDYGNFDDLIEKLDYYLTNNPKKRPDGKDPYLDHYKTIINWAKKDSGGKGKRDKIPTNKHWDKILKKEMEEGYDPEN
jgi:hypothetical protein